MPQFNLPFRTLESEGTASLKPANVNLCTTCASAIQQLRVRLPSATFEPPKTESGSGDDSSVYSNCSCDDCRRAKLGDEEFERTQPSKHTGFRAGVLRHVFRKTEAELDAMVAESEAAYARLSHMRDKEKDVWPDPDFCFDCENKVEVNGPTIEELSLSKTTCCLCDAIHRCLEQDNIQSGSPKRCSKLRLVQRNGHLYEGRTAWYIDNPYNDMINRHRGLAGIAFGVEGDVVEKSKDLRPSDPPLSIPTAQGFKIVAAHNSPEYLRRLCIRQEVSLGTTDETLERASAWLHECELQHPDCRRTLGGSDIARDAGTPLPTRVIDVRDNTQARLLHTEGATGRYVALSYRWGQKQMLTLTKENIALLQNGLPVTQLPKTVVDAIHATRRLGFDYLWVDAICIVQDDPNDWEREARSMFNVYQYATLTFAILGKRDGDTGFLERQHEPPWLSIPYEEYGNDDRVVTGDGLLVFGESLLPPSEEFTLTELSQEINSSTWNERGWTLQERMLSRRILYFGAAQMFWECHQVTKSEDGYEDNDNFSPSLTPSQSAHGLYWASELQNGVVSAVGRRFLSNWSAANADEEADDDEGRGYKYFRRYLYYLTKAEANATWAWKSIDFIEKMAKKGLNLDGFPGFLEAHMLVSLYTRRQLSKSRDKLIAFEGLATLYAKKTKQEFIAGIFTKRFSKSLFWNNLAGIVTTPIPLRAPSWSWASRDGPVELDTEAMLSDAGGFDGSLGKPRVVEGNVIMRNDDESACRPLSLEAKAVCMEAARSTAPCSSYPAVMQQLKDDVKLWSQDDNVWPYDHCHLMYIRLSSGQSKYEPKHGEYTCPRCHNGLQLNSDGHINRHVELCDGLTTFDLPREDRLATLIGVALFDDPNKAPQDFEAILLWHRDKRNRIVVGAKNAGEWLFDDHTGKPVWDPKPKVNVWPKSFDQVLNFAGPATEYESREFLKHRRQYFFLLVVPGPKPATYERVGIGIGYWIPQVERFGGVQVNKAFKQKTVFLL